MRKVVDSNMLGHETLRGFLAKSRGNFAVLTDYSAMEAYKSNLLQRFRDSMAIVIDYPEQVLVLKGTRKLSGLNARGTGLQRRMIDERETKEFATFCRALRVATDRQLQEQFDGYVTAATAQMERMLADAGTLGYAIELVAKTYNEKELWLSADANGIPAR